MPKTRAEDSSFQTSDSHNNVFGRTLNPWNTALGPGGSSGGEGALIALRGSPLGVGTDIGGKPAATIRNKSLPSRSNKTKAPSEFQPYAAGYTDSGPAQQGSPTAECACAPPAA